MSTIEQMTAWSLDITKQMMIMMSEHVDFKFDMIRLLCDAIQEIRIEHSLILPMMYPEFGFIHTKALNFVVGTMFPNKNPHGFNGSI